jgi:hypothetical protein
VPRDVATTDALNAAQKRYSAKITKLEKIVTDLEAVDATLAASDKVPEHVCSCDRLAATSSRVYAPCTSNRFEQGIVSAYKWRSLNLKACRTCCGRCVESPKNKVSPPNVFDVHFAEHCQSSTVE